MLTSNQKKFDEYQSILGLYGLKLDRRQPVDGKKIIDLFQENDKVEYVLRETSDLFNYHTHEVSQKDIHLERVYNKAELIVNHIDHEGNLCSQRFSQQIEGYIDLEKRSFDEETFDWDDVFVVATTQMTYHEMKRQGLKKSARDLVLAEFFKHYLHYDQRLDLQFNPQGHQETVDFEKSVAAFIQENKYLTNPHMSQYGLENILYQVINQGVFFRSAGNRREKNYWSPGLNGGIPLTPKRDDIHEITFMFHDLMHFAMPDLVYTGQSDPLSRKIYIAYRMISEAITLVLADMLFVDTLAQSGIDYDFTKRRIYPLFKSLDLNFESDLKSTLKTLLEANVRYALIGDDIGFRRLLKSNDDTALEHYKGKYEQYFIADYQWTAKNFDHMATRSTVYTQWVNLLGRDLFHKSHLMLLDEYVQHIKNKYLVSANSLESVVFAVFESVFDQIIWPALKQPSIIEETQATSNAFRRYMLGQCLIFAKYPFAIGSYAMGERLTQYLKRTSYFSKEEIARLRQFYNLFVDLLVNNRVISQDDQIIFKQIHPLFDPFYVLYESKTPQFTAIGASALNAMDMKEAA